MKLHIAHIAWALLSCAAITGCSGDDVVGPDAATDATTDATKSDASKPDAAADATTDALGDAPVDSSSDVAIDAPSDASDAGDASDAPAVVNGCTSFVDRSGTNDTREVDFPTTAAPAQYNPPCILIAAGQSVTFAGSFTDHPLAPFGGDTGNPIQSTSSGTTATFAFPAAGTFGFHCAFHPGIMFGAVLVQ